MSNLYRGSSIDASYQVSVHLAKGFERRKLKCEKLTKDRRRTPSDGKSSHCLWQGELKRSESFPGYLPKFDFKILKPIVPFHNHCTAHFRNMLPRSLHFVGCSSWEVLIVRFIDSGGIDDHRCFNFLFVIAMYFMQKDLRVFHEIYDSRRSNILKSNCFSHRYCSSCSRNVQLLRTFR
jgi:hypothetical protein